MEIEIILGDITNEETTAIVNAANTSLLGGGGVDGAIHRKAGKELLKECSSLGGCPTGEARITKGYSLKAKWIIHTPGPIWNGGNNNEEKLLRNSYINSLKLCEENNIESVAFPSISTGVYNFPLDKASKIAIKAIYDFLSNSKVIKKVRIICFDEITLRHYMKGSC